jgi:hypothetical protein
VFEMMPFAETLEDAPARFAPPELLRERAGEARRIHGT